MYTCAGGEVTCGGTRFGPELIRTAKVGFCSNISPCSPCFAEGAARDARLSVYDNNTQELQTDFCLILLEGCCSTRIYFGFSAKKIYAEIPPKHTYICFSWKQKKTIIRKSLALLLISGALSKFH